MGNFIWSPRFYWIQLVALAKRTFKSKKGAKYKEFVETIDINTNYNYIWNALKILKNRWVNVISSHTPENLQKENQIKALDKSTP